jgi:Ran-binding protein 1
MNLKCNLPVSAFAFKWVYLLVRRYDEESGKIWMLMRRIKTLKVCVNFFVKPSTDVQEHPDTDKAMLFTTMDDSEGDIGPVMVKMCCKFDSREKASWFKVRTVL